MGLRPLEILYSYSAGIDIRRQNLTSTDRRRSLTYKEGPSAGVVKTQYEHLM